ncbi:MAG: hypothetical protein V2I57_02860 [Xanthomonadales bacterium]|nr:hypothetical protein [Xanthomonadales bacterium]
MEEDAMNPDDKNRPTHQTSDSKRDSDHEKRAAEDSDERESRSGIQGAGTG